MLYAEFSDRFHAYLLTGYFLSRLDQPGGSRLLHLLVACGTAWYAIHARVRLHPARALTLPIASDPTIVERPFNASVAPPPSPRPLTRFLALTPFRPKSA
eukprot:4596017-Pleurochrysis_carterae.AAC.2